MERQEALTDIQTRNKSSMDNLASIEEELEKMKVEAEEAKAK